MARREVRWVADRIINLDNDVAACCSPPGRGGGRQRSKSEESFHGVLRGVGSGDLLCSTMKETRLMFVCFCSLFVSLFLSFFLSNGCDGAYRCSRCVFESKQLVVATSAVVSVDVHALDSFTD